MTVYLNSVVLEFFLCYSKYRTCYYKISLSYFISTTVTVRDHQLQLRDRQLQLRDHHQLQLVPWKISVPLFTDHQIAT